MKSSGTDSRQVAAIVPLGSAALYHDVASRDELSSGGSTNGRSRGKRIVWFGPGGRYARRQRRSSSPARSVANAIVGARSPETHSDSAAATGEVACG